MDDRILGFIENLRNRLAGLPKEEIDEAVSYYEEYLNEAAEEGKNIDNVIAELDSPDDIAWNIKMEISIRKVQHSPGIRNFTGALRNAFKSVSAPVSVFLLSVVELMAYGMVAILFGGAFAAAAAGGAGFIVLVYEGIRIPGQFVLEKLGAFGIALLAGSILMITAVYLYRCGRLFIGLCAKLIRRILVKAGKAKMQHEEQQGSRAINRKRTVRALLAVLAAGILLMAVSGLPWRYFVITNSMKPEGMIKNAVTEYDPGTVSRISVVTAHSVVKVKQGTSDKIVVSYEQPDWMDYSVENKNGMLSFKEMSNGRLPLSLIITLHESMTELVISLPAGYEPGSLDIESRGGDILISAAAGNIDVKTLSGSIDCDSTGTDDSYEISASTITGIINSRGVEYSAGNDGVVEYHNGVKSDKKLNISTTGGSISIE